MGGLTTGGRLKQPHLVSPAELKKLGLQANEVVEEDYPIQESTVDIVVKGMWGVVNEDGTGITQKSMASMSPEKPVPLRSLAVGMRVKPRKSSRKMPGLLDLRPIVIRKSWLPP